MVAAASSNWVPTQLGRYEVLGELATGGMAQILLARLGGASGFERTVVIKRILPHLARDKAFVAMFLDEARIVGSIHHPNVVQVHELCRDDDELYLVMEYLEGESLFGIMRRLQRMERAPPYGLSAYVLAEACDGLHNAHELRGPDGKPVNLVHRDISPHNIFVTYRGAVKVIDFGIAKTDNRKNRTETGQLKGKFEYMSPEQCAAEPCDRRADVYALGIVLYELTTGRRLFKRKNELLTIKAVTEAPIIPPTVLRPDYPGQLEQIVMRALERDPVKRYQTCADMRGDLANLLRQDRKADEPPEAQMIKLMSELFSERIDEKQKMIESIAKGSSPKSLPPPEVDLQYTVPEIDEEALQSHTHMRKVGETRPGATVKAARPDVAAAASNATRVTGSAPRRAPHLDPSKPLPPPPAVPGEAAKARSGTTHSGHTNPGATRPETTHSGNTNPGTTHSGTTHSGTHPGVAIGSRRGLVALLSGVLALGGVLLWIQLTPVTGEIQASEAAGTTGRPSGDVVTVSFTSEPPGAQIWLDGVAIGNAPASGAVPKGEQPVTYIARLPGHAESFGSFVPSRDQRFNVVFNPQAGARQAPAAAASKAPQAAPTERAPHQSRRSRSRGSRGYEPPAPQSAPSPGRSTPSGDPFRRFD